MLYLDTSVLVAALVPEVQTKQVHDWLLTHRSHELVISDWVLTEFASALAIKRRTGQLSPAESHQATRAFEELARDMLTVIPLLRQDFSRAAELIRSTRNLRAGDALHLAAAERVKATVCSLDRAQLSAADEVAVATDPILC